MGDETADRAEADASGHRTDLIDGRWYPEHFTVRVDEHVALVTHFVVAVGAVKTRKRIVIIHLNPLHSIHSIKLFQFCKFK